MVELRIANNPIRHDKRKKALMDFPEIDFSRNVPYLNP